MIANLLLFKGISASYRSFNAEKMTEILQLMVDNVQQKKFNVMTIFFFKHQILLSFSQILKKKDTGTQ